MLSQYVTPLIHIIVICAGKMELLCKRFFPAVKAVLDTPGIVVLGTLPAPPTQGRRDIAEVGVLASVTAVSILSCCVAKNTQLAVTGLTRCSLIRYTVEVPSCVLVHHARLYQRT